MDNRLEELLEKNVILEVKDVKEDTPEVGKTYFKGYHQKCITVTSVKQMLIKETAFPYMEVIDEFGNPEVRSCSLQPGIDFEVILEKEIQMAG